VEQVVHSDADGGLTNGRLNGGSGGGGVFGSELGRKISKLISDGVGDATVLHEDAAVGAPGVEYLELVGKVGEAAGDGGSELAGGDLSTLKDSVQSVEAGLDTRGGAINPLKGASILTSLPIAASVAEMHKERIKDIGGEGSAGEVANRGGIELIAQGHEDGLELGEVEGLTGGREVDTGDGDDGAAGEPGSHDGVGISGAGGGGSGRGNGGHGTGRRGSTGKVEGVEREARIESKKV
jgi:hypothetical protein